MTTRARRLERRLASRLRPLRRRLARLELARVELGTVVAFHAVGTAAIALTPDRNLITAATAPLFLIGGRPLWFVVFAAATIASALCWQRPTGRRQWATWLLVFPTGAAWVTSFAGGLSAGGNVFGLIGWPVLLTLWAVTAARLARRTEA